jgi:hypothetical protein
MLKHNYQNWWSQYVSLSETTVSAVAAVAVVLGLLSMLKPDFARGLAVGAWRLLARRVRMAWLRVLMGYNAESGSGVWVGAVFIPDEARRRHMQILGASGMGKTVLLEHLIRGDIARGMGMVIIDPKGDREFFERIKAYCREVGRASDLHLFSSTTPDESVRWNPCAFGTAAQLQSKWFNSGIYENPFYATACSRALLEAFDGLVEDMDSFTLNDLLARLEAQNNKQKSEHIQGLFNELMCLKMSDWGELLCAPRPGHEAIATPIISMPSIVRKNEILFVEMSMEASAEENKRLGKLLLMELMLLSGVRKGAVAEKGRRPFSVFVDEFDGFASEGFTTFFNKGRSSDLMIHMAHHTVGDLEKVSEHLKKVVMTICSNRAIFRSGDPDEADYLARLIGTRQVIKKTFRTTDGLKTGESSNRETEEFLVHPNRIKNLDIGECVFQMKTEKFTEVLRLPMPSRKPGRRNAAERYTPRNVTTEQRRLDRTTAAFAGMLREEPEKEG